MSPVGRIIGRASLGNEIRQLAGAQTSSKLTGLEMLAELGNALTLQAAAEVAQAVANSCYFFNSCFTCNSAMSFLSLPRCL